MNENQKPEQSIRIGSVAVAIWSQQQKTKDGRDFTSHRVVLDKGYRDAQGEWGSTNRLEPNDIPKAILALSKAYAYLMSSSETPPEGPH